MYVIPTMIIGAPRSGKTEFIRAVSEIEVVSTESVDRPLSFDFGRITPDDTVVIYFFGQPGGISVRYIGESPPLFTQRKHFGYLVVVDSVFAEPWYVEELQSYNQEPIDGPSNDHIAIATINWVREQGKPFLVVANKQDKDGARSIEEMRAVLQLDDDIPFLPCSARTDPASVRHALIELLKLVPQDEVVQQAIVNLQKLQNANH